MKKIIGITSSLTPTQNILNSAYIKAFTTKKTTPFIIPNIFEQENEIITLKDKENLIEHLETIVETIDALVLSGGADVNPISFNEKIKDSSGFSYARDYTETILISMCIKKHIPILGICRGFQILGINLRLNNFQQSLSITKEEHNGTNSDISNRKEPMHNTHIFGHFKTYCNEQGMITTNILTNSWHEQGFTLMPKGDRITNKDLEDFVTQKVEFKDKDTKEILNDFPGLDIIMSTNHVIEGFEHKLLPIVGFQFHPEAYTNSIAINYFLNKYVNKTYEEKTKTN